MDTIWFIIIIILLIFSLIINNNISFETYKIFPMMKKFIQTQKSGFFMSLGTKIGVGSIIGTTMSIYLGGPGSVFWILLFSLLTSPLIYYESFNGNKYKVKKEGMLIGGPYFYIKNKTLAIIFTILLIVCYSFLFQMIQLNTISSIILINFNVSKILLCSIFLIIVGFLLFFSIKELVNSMQKIVPIMCLIYIILGIFVIVVNAGSIKEIIHLIIGTAFTKRGILVGCLIGIKRAIFLNEIMIGTTSVSSGVDDMSPQNSAINQVIGMYFITFVICVITSILVLTYKVNNIFYVSNYNELISNVFTYHFGFFGILILVVIILLFALTTIISGCYIGISNLKILFKNKKLIFVFKLFVLLFCIGGIIIETDIIWKYIDLFMLVLIIINIYSLYKIFRSSKNDRK